MSKFEGNFSKGVGRQAVFFYFSVGENAVCEAGRFKDFENTRDIASFSFFWKVFFG